MNSQWLMIKGDEVDEWFDTWHAFIKSCQKYAVDREIAEAGNRYDDAVKELAASKALSAWLAETLQSAMRFHFCVPVGPSR